MVLSKSSRSGQLRRVDVLVHRLSKQLTLITIEHVFWLPHVGLTPAKCGRLRWGIDICEITVERKRWHELGIINRKLLVSQAVPMFASYSTISPVGPATTISSKKNNYRMELLP